MSSFFEHRKTPVRSSANDNLAADIMRHLHTRQYLGKAVVVCDQPAGLLSNTRKQWLRLARSLQRQRASTLNADKILKFTHGIAHMQHLRFSAKLPLDQPDADVFFLQPGETHILPAQCFTLYVNAAVTPAIAQRLAEQLPAQALVVEYGEATTDWRALGLQPKKSLEKHVDEAWQQVQQFLVSCNIDIAALHQNDLRNVEAMDDALDTLLGLSHRFLHVASDFQHALELARPMRIPKNLHEKYDSLILLAHRVQALTPGAFSQQFLQVYSEDDTFFFHEHVRRLAFQPTESLTDAFRRHTRAGRHRLASTLQTLAEVDS